MDRPGVQPTRGQDVNKAPGVVGARVGELCLFGEEPQDTGQFVDGVFFGVGDELLRHLQRCDLLIGGQLSGPRAIQRLAGGVGGVEPLGIARETAATGFGRL